MDFWKMNGAGNDFIIINNMDESIPSDEYSYLAKTLCERHLSIGADGMMFVEKPTDGGDFRMQFYNSDGSKGEMCGNGARCICRYGYENGLSGAKSDIETTAGHVGGERINERLYKIRLNDPSVIKPDQLLDVCGQQVKCAYVELGNPGIPHLVVLFEDVRQLLNDDEKNNHLETADRNRLFEIGANLRSHPALAKGANVNFIEILPDGNVFERTFERGVEDFTYACGTGTGSAGVVLFLKKLMSPEDMHFNMRGGELIININTDGDKVTDLFLTGPTNIVAKGEITDEKLSAGTVPTDNRR